MAYYRDIILEPGEHGDKAVYEGRTRLLLQAGEHRFPRLFTGTTVIMPAGGVGRWEASVNSEFGRVAIAQGDRGTLDVRGLMIRSGLHGIKAQGLLRASGCLFYGCALQGIQSNFGRARIMHNWFIRCGFARRWEHCCYLYGPGNILFNNIFENPGYLALTFPRATSNYAAGGGWVSRNLMHVGGANRLYPGLVEVSDPTRTVFVWNTIQGTVICGGQSGKTDSCTRIGPSNLTMDTLTPNAYPFVSQRNGIYWLHRPLPRPAGCYPYDARRTHQHALKLYRSGYMGIAFGKIVRPVLPTDTWDLEAT